MNEELENSFDAENLTVEELQEFYWNNPEAIPDSYYE